MVPITFRFIIPLTWCHRRSITSSWKPLDKFVVIIVNILSSSKIYIEFLMGNTILAPRWFMLSSTTLLHSVQHKLVRVLCYTLRSLLSSICSHLPWSIAIFYVKNVVRISPPLENSWYNNTSRHLCSFLGPRVVFNRNTNNWAMTREFKTSSNPFTLKWMGDSFILILCSLSHHFNIVRASQPIFRVHLSTNV